MNSQPSRLAVALRFFFFTWAAPLLIGLAFGLAIWALAALGFFQSSG